MHETRTSTDRPTTTPVSADPLTAQQLREPVEPVLAGRDPLAMDEAIGAHDGSDQAGAVGWTTSQGAGMDTATDVSEGRASTQADVAAGDDVGVRGGADPGAGVGGGTAGNAGGDSRMSAGRAGVTDSTDAPARTSADDLGGRRDDPVRRTTDPVGAVGEIIGDDVVALLDLPRWTEHLHALPTWREGDRASSMLLRQPPVRVLLTALRQDAELGSDGAQETLMLLVLSGAASIEWRGEVARIGQGELAVVPTGGGWRVTSEADETLVLSTFWGTPGTGQADEAAA